MNIMKILRVSFRALGRNKLRSFLTILGIIIGVGAVIAMVSIGEGAKAAVQARFNAMGTNLLFVSPGNHNFHGLSSGTGGWNTLKIEDALAIEANCPSVKSTSPNADTRAQIVYNNKNWNTRIQGTGSRYPEIRNWVVGSGSFFDEAMVKMGAKVCVIGSDIRTNLFPDEEPLGKIIRIKKIPFQVLGVFQSKGDSGGWFNRDDIIAVPYTTVMNRLMGVTYLDDIDVQAVSADKTAEAQREIEELLRLRHRILPGSDDDFAVRNMSDIAASAAESTQILTVFLGSIAGISLLVGGIGIMNIMLVSVTERIREIGIRMAVGAREWDILLQFLSEAIVLSVFGGLLGIGLGIGLSKLIPMIPIFSGWKGIVSVNSIVLACVFSGSVGIFFGFYPARKASKLDPIEALRYE